MKRTELRRGQPLRVNPAKQRAWQQRTRSRLPLRSARRAAEASERRRVVQAVIERDKTCQGREAFPDVECYGPLQGHEPLPRSRGGDYLDPSQVVALCSAHHAAVHSYPLEAKAAGLLR